MFGNKKLLTGLLLISLFLAASLVTVLAWWPSQRVHSLGGVPFDYVEIDAAVAGDCKMVGDIDGDGYPDLVIGGMPNEKLSWYRYPDWSKTVIATPGNEFTTDGALGDVDGDGDLDIVVPDGDAGDNLIWFENPRPSGDPAVGTAWTRHGIGAIGSWGKDVKLADVDDNGLLDVATRNNSQAMIFFQSTANSWVKTPFSDLELGEEGMASGDIDGDGHIDLVLRGVWLQNPGGTQARTAANWTQWTIGEADANFKALVVDLNQDGQNDLLFSSSEGTADVNWWTPTGSDPTGAWTKHTIVPMLERAHTLQAADMDNDGDIDVVLGQMHTAAAKELIVMFNTNGQATSWSKQTIAANGLHNGVVADIGNDGDFDIFGANWTGNPPVKLWLNSLDPAQSPLPLNRWTYLQVSNSHAQTFGLDFGDLSGDGIPDILSGAFWYRNPGGDMLAPWAQRAFPDGLHALLALDVDGDALPDVISHKDEGDIALYWLEATDSTAADWNAVKIGTVPRASHDLGAQGHRVAQIEAGGKVEIATSSGDGVFYFRIPADPAAGNWPRIHIHTNPSDEGFAFGDIDNDGDLDMAATTGDAKGVEWYANPGDGTENWQAIAVGSFPNAVYPDRTEIADLNGDARLDIVATEENGEDADAESHWWQQPDDPVNGEWTRHLLVSQATTNSLDVADMNQDGTPDIVLGEHRGTQKLSILDNHGQATFTEQVVDSGKESHLGARVVDLDQDGDLDIVSIAWDAPQFVHLWRNDAIDSNAAPPTSTPPSSTPTSEPSETPTVPPVTAPTSESTQTPTIPPMSTATSESAQTPAVTPMSTSTSESVQTPTAPPVTTPTSESTQTPTVPPVTTPVGGGAGRVTNGLVVLYIFRGESGRTASGEMVHDVSGVGVPLDLTIEEPSATQWLTTGLEITLPTRLTTQDAATKVIDALRVTGELSLEAWISYTQADQQGPARILTLSVDPMATGGNLMLGQELGALQVRLRSSATDQFGQPSLDVVTDSVEHDFLHIVFTRDPAGTTRLFLNGELVASGTTTGDFTNWDARARLALANEPTGERPWLGIFHLAAIYDRALTAEEVESNYNDAFQMSPAHPAALRIPHVIR